MADVVGGCDVDEVGAVCTFAAVVAKGHCAVVHDHTAVSLGAP